MVQPPPSASLFRMVKPADFDCHRATPRLPEKFDATDVGTIGSCGRQEHGTIANLRRNPIVIDQYTKCQK